MSSLKKKFKEATQDKLPFYNSLVKPLHLAEAVAAGVRFGFPAKKLRVIGVTGTNGKTTTSFMIWKMLNESGHPTGIMSTVGWGGVSRQISASADALLAQRMSNTSRSATPASLNSARDTSAFELHSELNHMTTVDSKTLNRRIKAIREAGAEFLVLETTSHALAQFRTLGVPIEIAVFTNLTHEHLDYHKTIENYRNAKLKLIKKAKYSVINADDKNGKYFVKAAKDYITYGVKNGKFRAKKVETGVFGVKYEVSDSSHDIKIQTKIPGEFNVYNSLAAAAVGEKLGLSAEEIRKGIFALESVEGRMNRIYLGEEQEFSVIVDYAHTPDALEKVFKAVENNPGRIIAVHGGAGRRDESTRFSRGKILGENSDIVIITEDDSRDEDPEKIAAEFKRGAEEAGKKEGKNLVVELDREKAINAAIRLAKKNDLVLILGKGHEKTILRGEKAVPFEDIKVAEKAVKQKLDELKKQRELEEKKRETEKKKQEEIKKKRLEKEEAWGNIV